MAFTKKTWVDRLVEYAGRRKLTNIATGATQVVDVTRNEGTVSAEGDAFNAENMNNLESRIYDTFAEITKVYTNVSVAASAWRTYTASLTGESDIVGDYPYKADVTLSGMTANHCAKVSFAPAEVADGVFAPYNNTQSGKIRIYAKSAPISAITIPTIYAVKKGV